MKNIITLRDAMKKKVAAEAAAYEAGLAREAAKQAVAAILASNPQIGVLNRNGKAVYYVNFPQYREASTPAAFVVE